MKGLRTLELPKSDGVLCLGVWRLDGGDHTVDVRSQQYFCHVVGTHGEYCEGVLRPMEGGCTVGPTSTPSSTRPRKPKVPKNRTTSCDDAVGGGAQADTQGHRVRQEALSCGDSVHATLQVSAQRSTGAKRTSSRAEREQVASRRGRQGHPDHVEDMEKKPWACFGIGGAAPRLLATDGAVNEMVRRVDQAWTNKNGVPGGGHEAGAGLGHYAIADDRDRVC